VLVDTDSHGVEDLLRLLKRYRLRQKLDIQDVSGQYAVWAQYGGSTAAVAAARAAPPPGWAPDPRLPQLGLRAVLPVGEGGGGGSASSGGVDSSSSSSGGGSNASWRDHRRWRILQGVAEGDSEIPTGAPHTLLLLWFHPYTLPDAAPAGTPCFSLATVLPSLSPPPLPGPTYSHRPAVALQGRLCRWNSTLMG
jgi:hypothetical protein